MDAPLGSGTLRPGLSRKETVRLAGLVSLLLVPTVALYGYAVAVWVALGDWPTHNQPDPGWCMICDIAVSGLLLASLLSPAAALLVFRGVPVRRGFVSFVTFVLLWIAWFYLLSWDPWEVRAWFVE